MLWLFLVIVQARETIVVRHTDVGYVYAVFNADVYATSVTGHSDRSEMEQDWIWNCVELVFLGLHSDTGRRLSIIWASPYPGIQ